MWRLLLAVPLLLVGFFFLAVGTIGLLRLPDIYTRMHATGKCDTLGAGLTLLALIVLAPNPQTALKIGLVAGLILVINPTTAHVVANAAYRYGGHEMPGTAVYDLRGSSPPDAPPDAPGAAEPTGDGPTQPGAAEPTGDGPAQPGAATGVRTGGGGGR